MHQHTECDCYKQGIYSCPGTPCATHIFNSIPLKSCLHSSVVALCKVKIAEAIQDTIPKYGRHKAGRGGELLHCIRRSLCKIIWFLLDYFLSIKSWEWDYWVGGQEPHSSCWCRMQNILLDMHASSLAWCSGTVLTTVLLQSPVGRNPGFSSQVTKCLQFSSYSSQQLQFTCYSVT